jgi:NAD(P)H-hydrate repair Nnr-like enzyme with NAD(P)H-hydrate dehydratase domain
LLDCTASEIQADRLGHANELAQRFGAVVVLKGSGSVIATSDRIAGINPTGNARLATAGTGDVLAGMIGARLAQGDSPWEAATRAVFWHGQAADQWPANQPLIADRLVEVSPGRQTASASP